MKKSILALILAALLLVLTACGAEKKTESEPFEEPETDVVSEPETVEKMGEETSEEPEKDPCEIEGGASMEEARELQFNTRYYGKYREGEVWVSFTTGEKEDVPYRITLENLSAGSEALDGYLIDKDGNGLRSTEHRNGDNDYRRAVRATQDGTADTAMFNYLEPNTTYYLRLQAKGKVEYSLRITDPNGEPFDTTAGRTVITASDEYVTATNQDDAPLLVANTRYQGKYVEGYQWIAFQTGEKEDVPYRITLENLSAGSEALDGYLVTEYGDGLRSTEHRNGDNDYRRAVRATQDGTADTAMFNYLEPNTTYYLRLQAKGKVEYLLTVNGPEDPDVSDDSTIGVEDFLSGNQTDVPGTSQSFALNVPLGTKVSARYTSGYSWLAFTTNETEDARYYLTLINCTVGSEALDGYLVDKDGNGLRTTEHRNGDNDYRRAVRAMQDGRADTAMFANLEPNTTYYLRLQGKSKVDYTVRVYSPSVPQGDAYSTSSSLTESVGTLGGDEEFYTGTNQNIATLLKANTRYHGKYIDGYSWVSFTTGEDEDAEYKITLENLTVGSKPLDGYLADEFGTALIAAQYHNGDRDYRRAVRANEDGTADTVVFNTLDPNTTYYIWIQGGSKAEYFLTIGAPEPEESGNTIEEENEEDVVFEVPFELNDTQVRFVADQAVFIDEEEAKEALAPVAEIILAHPDHPILLAGTTAQAGTQENCEKLSDRRAAAVRDLLVNEFGVPDSQLISVGLGYEKDPFVRGRDRDADGNFVETEGAKNRRVVVLDAESDIARQILGN